MAQVLAPRIEPEQTRFAGHSDHLTGKGKGMSVGRRARPMPRSGMGYYLEIELFSKLGTAGGGSCPIQRQSVQGPEIGFNCLINKQDMKRPGGGSKKTHRLARGTDSVPGTARDGTSPGRTPLGSPGRPPHPPGAASWVCLGPSASGTGKPLNTPPERSDCLPGDGCAGRTGGWWRCWRGPATPGPWRCRRRARAHGSPPWPAANARRSPAPPR